MLAAGAALAPLSSRRAHARSPLAITDVSPDAAFGEPASTNQQDPAGRVTALVIDPSDARVLYAATENSGVWKSTDRARSWHWASQGLGNGSTAAGPPALAVDDTAGARVLYASDDDDFTSSGQLGGLYVSRDGAASWRHVSLSGCPRPRVRSVAFSGGVALVGSDCGVHISADLVHWRSATPPGGGRGFVVTASGATIYACAGTTTWQATASPTPPALRWTAGPALARDCERVIAAPDDPAHHALVLSGGDRMTLAVLDFSARPPSVDLLPATVVFQAEGSGQPVLAAARRPHPRTARRGPGFSYDVFVGDGLVFAQFVPGSPHLPGMPPEAPAGWARLEPIHVDTHAFVLPPSYDPDRGHCDAFAASDGGVFATRSGGTDACEVFRTGWVRAMHGLHAFGSYAVAGVPQKRCAGGSPCPALYLAANDNALWGSANGGRSWSALPCCGDNGDVYIDAAAPDLVSTFRLGDKGVFRSRDGKPPLAGVNVAERYPIDVTVPGLRRGIVQILTPRGASAARSGDYLAIERPSPADATHDTIVRNHNPTAADPASWVDVAPDNPFPRSSLVAVQASNGHDTPTIYALAAGPGAGDRERGVWKATLDASSGQVAKGGWKRMSAGLGRPIALVADPYDPSYLYAADLDDGTIKSSKNGGQTWRSEPVLTGIATRNGRFVFDCGQIDDYVDRWHDGSTSHRYSCPLNQVAFVRDHPEIHVAVLHPGGIAFSRDAGADWIPLPVTAPIDVPTSAFYDPTIDPTTGTPSLYVALHGRGLIRIDAPFDTIVGLRFELRGAAADLPIQVEDDATGLATALERGPDGIYRGTEVFDPARARSTVHTYHYRIVGHGRSRDFRRTLGPGELAVGVAGVTDSVDRDRQFQ